MNKEGVGVKNLLDDQKFLLDGELCVGEKMNVVVEFLRQHAFRLQLIGEVLQFEDQREKLAVGERRHRRRIVVLLAHEPLMTVDRQGRCFTVQNEDVLDLAELADDLLPQGRQVVLALLEQPIGENVLRGHADERQHEYRRYGGQ